MIIRTEKNSHYTTICNDALNDPNLSLKAKGLWAFLMTKPETWSINYRGLKSQLKEGQSAILAALKELEDGKYLVRGNIHAVGNGKFEQAQATLYEKPCVENPRTGNPRTENPRTKVTTDEVRTKQDSDDKSSLVAEATSGYGRYQLTMMFDFWAQTTGLPIQRLVKRNRFACFSLLKVMSEDELCELIQAVRQSEGDKFAPVITDFISLEFKLDQLQTWRKRHSPAPAVNVAAMLYPEKYGHTA